jgi:hypothetical protein
VRPNPPTRTSPKVKRAVFYSLGFPSIAGCLDVGYW